MMPIVIDLNTYETTLIIGTNGVGKSTLLDALCFVLYKKAFRDINLEDLINSINAAELMVTVEFSIGTDEYEVRRGLKPAVFEIYKNGELRKVEAASKDPQKYLEDEVLQVGYKSFTQVVLLGNAKYTPFMKLDAKEKREFIEHILDIGVFSQMNRVLSERQKLLKISLDTIGKSIVSAEEKAILVEGFIARLESEQAKATVDNQSEIDRQHSIIGDTEPMVEFYQNQVQEYTATLTAQTLQLAKATEASLSEQEIVYEADLAELEKQILDTSTLENKIVGFGPIKHGILKNVKTTTESLEFYTQNKSCKTCKQTIHTDFRDTIVEEKRAQIVKFQDGLVKLDTEIEKYSAKIAGTTAANRIIQKNIVTLTNAYKLKRQQTQAESRGHIAEVTSTLQEQIRQHTRDLVDKQTTVKTAKQFLQRMESIQKTVNTSTNIDEQYAKQKTFKEEILAHQDLKNKAIETRHYYDVAGVLLKDTGIKAAIVKQYLSMINTLTNKYLEDLNFFLLFNLDENFNATFKSRHRDKFKYNSFSEGQKQRINLALLFAWRDLASMKNTCSTNLLILDEVTDSSLDEEGTELFIKMINAMSDASNVFVISHKKDFTIDHYSNILQFEMLKNFSYMTNVSS